MTKIETNNGLIADPEKLKDYIGFLAILTKKLDQSKNDAITSLVEMNKSGYKDETFKIFDEKFKKNIQYIEELKDQIKASADFYGINVELIEKHLNDTF